MHFCEGKAELFPLGENVVMEVVYATDRIYGFVLRKTQRGFNSTETWCQL
jgi:hypothetical protein